MPSGELPQYPYNKHYRCSKGIPLPSQYKRSSKYAVTLCATSLRHSCFSERHCQKLYSLWSWAATWSGCVTIYLSLCELTCLKTLWQAWMHCHAGGSKKKWSRSRDLSNTLALSDGGIRNAATAFWWLLLPWIANVCTTPSMGIRGRITIRLIHVFVLQTMSHLQ